MLFDTSAVSTSLPELNPVVSISTPLARPGVRDIGKQCAHFAKPSLIFGVCAAANAVPTSIIAIRRKARWKGFAITALRWWRPRRRYFRSSFPAQAGAMMFLHTAYNLLDMPLFSSRYDSNLGSSRSQWQLEWKPAA